MSQEVLLGPMFAGKSSYLLSVLRKYEAIGWPVMSITSEIDTRYEEGAIHSHNHERHAAFSTKALQDAKLDSQYLDAKLIVIEEAQFFEDLVPFVLDAVEKNRKDVLVIGLDGDAARNPFGHILELIPYCDKITKLTALCKSCGDGTAALFTHRITSEEDTISVGSDDKYEALCRKHFLIKTRHISLNPGYSYFE